MAKGPYELPKGWRWVKLGEVCAKPQYGVTQSASQEPVGPKFLRITDITSGYIDWDKVPYCQADQRALEKYRLTVGDILFARSGSVGAVILIKEQPPVDAVFASYLIRVRVNQTVVLPEFVELLVKSNFGQSQLVPRGAAQKNINAKRIQQIFIPLPPLPEQRRIVARIEELMERVREARRLREKAKKDADRLMQAALAEVFPRPGQKLPPGWKWVKLGEVCKVIMGQSPPSKTYNMERKGLPFFQGKADFGELYPTPRVWCSSPQKIAQPGDILISVRAPVGPTNLANVTCCIGRGLAALRVTHAIERKWLLYYFRNIESDLSHRGSGSTFSAITKRQLEELPIPLPSLPEQRRIVAYLDQVQARVTALQKAQKSTEAELHRLEQAILDKAFRGEL